MCFCDGSEACAEGSARTRASQRERLEMIRVALQNQIGVDSANSHYDIAGAPVPSNGRAVESSVEPPRLSTHVNGNGGGAEELDSMQDVDGDEGIYL